MTAPKRRLGLTVTAAIVVANMIGTGVFTSTGFQAASLHDPGTILLCWVVGGVLALCGAACYAELGSMMPRAGGEYVYLREAYHPAVGFMSGWVSLTAGFSAPIAAAAIAFSAYLATLVPALQSAEPWFSTTFGLAGYEATITLGSQQAVAMALIVAVTGLHSFDTKIGGWVQAAFTAAKVILITLFILGGVFLGSGDWGNLSPQAGGLANVGTAAFATSLMYVSFAYSGWNAAAYIANEVEHPEKTLPKALLLGTGTVMALYVLLNLVFLYAVPTQVLAGGDGGGPIVEVGDAAARALFGDSAGRLVTAVIAIALVSSVSAMIMAGPRVYAAMATDRALPHQLARHNKRGVPVLAVMTQGFLACLFVLVGDLGSLIRFVGFTLAIFAALTVGAVFILRARGHRSAFRTFGYPVTPIAFIALSMWIAWSQIYTQPRESAIVAALLAVGALLYVLFSRGKTKLPDESLPEGMPEVTDSLTDVPSARVVKRDDD
ncbi:MAG: amino acid permease [Deltaproteobacteria bacterium]|nr:amino acid permease [Deltaproteobacteria bacterium]